MKRKIIGGAVLGLALLSLVAALALGPGGERPGNYGGRPESYAKGDRVVGVIDISGAIMAGSATGIFGEEMAGDEVVAQLRQAARDPRVKAVVLRLNSPGGTAAASQEIADEVLRVKKAGKKVVASMGDVAASGAYWIAAGADRIVANPGTMTGSIGVIMDVVDLQGLYGKLGVDTNTFKSGPYKDMGSPGRDISPEEKKIFQGMVDDIYLQFVDTVSGGRKMSVEEVKKIADGRVFTGRQAQKLGLVDELGNFYDAVSLAGELSGLGPDPEIITFKTKGLWRGLLGNVKQSSPLAAIPGVGDIRPAIWLVCPAVFH